MVELFSTQTSHSLCNYRTDHGSCHHLLMRVLEKFGRNSPKDTNHHRWNNEALLTLLQRKQLLLPNHLLEVRNCRRLWRSFGQTQKKKVYWLTPHLRKKTTQLKMRKWHPIKWCLETSDSFFLEIHVFLLRNPWFWVSTQPTSLVKSCQDSHPPSHITAFQLFPNFQQVTSPGWTILNGVTHVHQQRGVIINALAAACTKNARLFWWKLGNWCHVPLRRVDSL